MEVEFHATPKRKKTNVSVGFLPRKADGSYDQEGDHGLHERDAEAFRKVWAALKEFGDYLRTVGEI
jgi:hypothetical protein